MRGECGIGTVCVPNRSLKGIGSLSSPAVFLLVFVPVLGAFVAHAPVLRFDLLQRLKPPIDGGATFRGRRLFGDNKTWRGALVMSCGIVLATLVPSAGRRPAP
jgi:hypothetical protein